MPAQAWLRQRPSLRSFASSSPGKAPLTHTVVIAIQTCLFRSVPLALFKFGYLGALTSYSIVILKSLGKPQLNIQWVQRAFVDENVQYAVLALYWFVSKPVNSK